MSVTLSGSIPRLLHCLIGRKKIAQAVFLNPFLAMATAVKKNRPAPSLDHPENHRDVDRPILRCAGYEFSEREFREVCITDGSYRVIRVRGSSRLSREPAA
jgi:hypothetical protein